MRNLFYIFLIVEAVMSLAAFIFYGADKYKAKKGKWRISERTLLLLAFFFGAPGAYLGMQKFRHKTQHKQFTIPVPVFLILQAALCVYLFYSAFIA